MDRAYAKSVVPGLKPKYDYRGVEVLDDSLCISYRVQKRCTAGTWNIGSTVNIEHYRLREGVGYSPQQSVRSTAPEWMDRSQEPRDEHTCKTSACVVVMVQPTILVLYGVHVG